MEDWGQYEKCVATFTDWVESNKATSYTTSHTKIGSEAHQALEPLEPMSHRPATATLKIG